MHFIFNPSVLSKYNQPIAFKELFVKYDSLLWIFTNWASETSPYAAYIGFIKIVIWCMSGKIKVCGILCFYVQTSVRKRNERKSLEERNLKERR